MRLRAILVASALALVLVAVAYAGGTLKGSWTAKISHAPAAQFNGVWKLTFAKSGAYTILENKQVLVRGKATFKGAKVTFHDKSGAAACQGKQAVGSYTWKLKGKTLRLTPVKESCSGRKFVLGRAFKKSN